METPNIVCDALVVQEDLVGAIQELHTYTCHHNFEMGGGDVVTTYSAPFSSSTVYRAELKG